jgi:hypothetical protein
MRLKDANLNATSVHRWASVTEKAESLSIMSFRAGYVTLQYMPNAEKLF